MSNFIQQCLRGDALLEDLDDFIDQWHESDSDLPIHTYLGMTLEEYGAWVEDSDILPYIVSAHKYRINFKEALQQAAAMAARSNDLSKTALLMHWLNSQGLSV